MPNAVLGLTDELLITSADGREFRLTTKDFPQPKLPHDRVDVEEQIGAMIQEVFPGKNLRVHIFSLEPLCYKVAMLPPDAERDWWVQ